MKEYHYRVEYIYFQINSNNLLSDFEYFETEEQATEFAYSLNEDWRYSGIYVIPLTEPTRG